MTAQDTQTDQSTPTKSVTFLMVDDDDVSIMAIRRALKKLKIINPLRVAKDGQQALNILRGEDNEPPCQTPLLVILDLNMPRMDGFEFLEELRKDTCLRSTIVFILSTSDTPTDVTSAYAQNVAGYIVKDDLGDSFIKALDMIDTYVKVVEMPDI